MKQKVYNWTKKEKDLIIKIVKDAKKHLNIESWTILNIFEDGPIIGENLNGKMFITDALNSVTQEYEKQVITWKPALLEDIRTLGLDAINECVYHELVHCLTQELWDIAMDRFTTEEDCRKAVERLTQRISKIICTLI